MKYVIEYNSYGAIIKPITPPHVVKWGHVTQQKWEGNNPALPVHPDSVPLLKGLTEWEGEVEEVWQSKEQEGWVDIRGTLITPENNPCSWFDDWETRKVAKLIAPEVRDDYSHLTKISENYKRYTSLTKDVTLFLQQEDAVYDSIDQAFRCGANFGVHWLLKQNESLTKENLQGEIKSAEEIKNIITDKAEHYADTMCGDQGLIPTDEWTAAYDAYYTGAIENVNLKAPAIDTGEKKEYEVSKESFSNVYPASFFVCPSCDKDTIEGACYCSNCGDKLIWNF